mgnify:FL=1
MKSVWFRQEHNRDAKKKADFETTIRNSRVIVDRLLEILDQREEALDRPEFDLANYDGGYPYKAAYLAGARKELKEIRDLFSFINDKQI